MLSIQNIILIASALLALFLGKDFVPQLFFKNENQMQKQEPLLATILPISVSRVQQYIRVSGNLNYRIALKIKPERRGQLTFINQNQFVDAGEVIAKLESSSEEAQLVKFTGALNKAKYQLERAKERARQPGIVAESEMKTYESEYQIALGDKKRAEAELNKMSIKAPAKGKLGIPNQSIGASVNESDVLCSFVSDDDMIVDFILSEAEAINIYAGKKIMVSSNLFGDRLFLHGIVEKVDPNADMTYGIKVRARIVDQQDTSKLSAGSSVTVSFDMENDEPVPNIPEKAIEERSGVNYVNLATKNDEGSFTVYKTAVDAQIINGLAIIRSLKPSEDKPIYYVEPVPGVNNLDNRQVVPNEKSKIQVKEVKKDEAKKAPETSEKNMENNQKNKEKIDEKAAVIADTGAKNV